MANSNAQFELSLPLQVVQSSGLSQWNLHGALPALFSPARSERFSSSPPPSEINNPPLDLLACMVCVFIYAF